MRMTLPVLLALAFTASPVIAHHSAAALYVMNQELDIEGTVTEYQFVNPHIRVYLDVENADGDVERWVAEGGNPNVLIRQGWDGEELQPGDRIRINGHPSRDGSPLIHWVTVTLPDGSELFAETVDFGAVDRRRRQRQED